jgi:hypothetical protein
MNLNFFLRANSEGKIGTCIYLYIYTFKYFFFYLTVESITYLN